MTFTRYHVLLLFPESVAAVSLVSPADRNASQVIDEEYFAEVNWFDILIDLEHKIRILKNVYISDSW